MTKIVALLGPAGTGKTTQISKMLETRHKWGLPTATTGIAALNLQGAMNGIPTVTINSLLRYFNTKSLEDSYHKGFLMNALMGIKKQGYQTIIIDEVSMLDPQQFRIIVAALDKLNAMFDESLDGTKPLNLVLVGDFLQLPPFAESNTASFIFECKEWERVVVNKLTKVHRQDDVRFLELLKACRQADGKQVAQALGDYGCYIDEAELNLSDSNVTIRATNKMVDQWNEAKFSLLDTPIQTYSSWSWGEYHKDWLNIPKHLPMRVGAYVMILANNYEERPDVPGGKQLLFANGDTGIVEEVQEKVVKVRLNRGGGEKVVTVFPICRNNYYYGNKPPELPKQVAEWLEEYKRTKELPVGYAEYVDKQVKAQLGYFDIDAELWVQGQITYLPLRCAYACTVHKTQGLTIDGPMVIDPAHKFFGEPNMFYVALSRARRLDQLKVVGNARLVESRVNTLRKLVQWM